MGFKSDLGFGLEKITSRNENIRATLFYYTTKHLSLPLNHCENARVNILTSLCNDNNNVHFEIISFLKQSEELRAHALGSLHLHTEATKISICIYSEFR